MFVVCCCLLLFSVAFGCSIVDDRRNKGKGKKVQVRLRGGTEAMHRFLLMGYFAVPFFRRLFCRVQSPPVCPGCLLLVLLSNNQSIGYKVPIAMLMALLFCPLSLTLVCQSNQLPSNSRRVNGGDTKRESVAFAYPPYLLCVPCPRSQDMRARQREKKRDESVCLPPPGRACLVCSIFACSLPAAQSVAFLQHPPFSFLPSLPSLPSSILLTPLPSFPHRPDAPLFLFPLILLQRSSSPFLPFPSPLVCL